VHDKILFQIKLALRATLLLHCMIAPPSSMSDEPGIASAEEESEHIEDETRSSTRFGRVEPRQAAEMTSHHPPSAAEEAADEGTTTRRTATRKRKAPIDIDDHIATARQRMKEAQKQVSLARALARNEKQKKQRLMKKAATLTSEDLERIAVWKRSGMDPMTGMSIAARANALAATSSTSGSGTPSSSPAVLPANHPAAASPCQTSLLRP
jgi:hypothetical protein